MVKNLRANFLKRKEFLRSQLKFLKFGSRGPQAPYKHNLKKSREFLEIHTKYLVKEPKLAKYLKSKNPHLEKIKDIERYFLEKNNNNYSKAIVNMNTYIREYVQDFKIKKESYSQLVDKFLDSKYKNKSKESKLDIKKQLLHDFINLNTVITSYLKMAESSLVNNKKRIN